MHECKYKYIVYVGVGVRIGDAGSVAGACYSDPGREAHGECVAPGLQEFLAVEPLKVRIDVGNLIRRLCVASAFVHFAALLRPLGIRPLGIGICSIMMDGLLGGFAIVSCTVGSTTLYIKTLSACNPMCRRQCVSVQALRADDSSAQLYNELCMMHESFHTWTLNMLMGMLMAPR